MSPAAEKKRRRHCNMIAEKQLAKKDKSKLHMRSFRCEITIDEKNKTMEMNRKSKKRERNSKSSKEKDKMHLNARNNIKNYALLCLPKKRQN